MGQMRRYQASMERREDARAARLRTRDAEAPDSLSNAELERHRLPTTKPPQPLRVLAWVRYGREAVRVQGHAVAWTPNAVAVQWNVLDVAGDTIIRQDRAWLWNGAVHFIDTLPSADPRTAINLRRSGEDD